MERIMEIEKNGKSVFLLDLSNCKQFEIEPLLEEAGKLIEQKSPNSLLTLTDVTNMYIDASFIALFKEFAVKNKPYVKAATVVGASGILGMAYGSVKKHAQREIISFMDKETALNYLSEQ